MSLRDEAKWGCEGELREEVARAVMTTGMRKVKKRG
jgi:hypothetical protein